ncbi:SPASM domain-containing protein [bacterium]|nr:SPASM domain-containing protein [bacterium]
MSLTDGIATFCQDHLAELDRPDEFVGRLCRTFDLAPEDACLLTLRIINERQRNALHPLIHLELVVTEACNLACDYCFCGPKRQAMMTPEVGQRAIDFLLRQSGSASTVYVTFFGGEPLLAMETIISVTLYGTAAAERAGKTIQWSMTSNGTLLSQAILEFCRDRRIKLLLSIDGDQATHDRHRLSPDGTSAYGALTRWLPQVKACLPWLGARMTITPDHAERSFANVHHLIELGFNQLLIAPAECPGWSTEAQDEFRRGMCAAADYYFAVGREKKLKIERFDLPAAGDKSAAAGRRGCRAGKTSVAVAPDGTLFPCSKFIKADSPRPPFTLGTLERGIANNKRLEQLRQTPWRASCLRCDYLFRCSGGCLATNYHATGSPARTSRDECVLKRMELAVDDQICQTRLPP